MTTKLKNMLTKNVGLKLISVIIAFLIWLLVTNTNNPRKSVLINDVPITVVNQDSIADISKVADLEGNGKVTLKVTERRSILDRLSKNDFYVEADLENINEMGTVPLTVNCNNSAVSWDEIEISPSSLKVTLEDKVEQPFAISVTTTGKVASGYEVGSTEVLQGKNIYIAGPASLMKILNQVVATVKVNGLNGNMTLTATLEVYDKNGSKLEDSQYSSLEFKDSNGAVITDRIVQVAVELWRVRNDISVEVNTTGTPAFGYRVAGISSIPVSISLAGTQEALDALDGKLTLTDEISVAGATENISQEIDLTNTLSQMSGLKLISDADPNILVEVQIEKNGDMTLSIPLSSIDLINKPANRNLVFTPADKVSIAIHAEEEGMEQLSEEDVKVSVDLSVCEEEGNHEIPLVVELPAGYELASDVTIMVNSERQETETAPAETE